MNMLDGYGMDTITLAGSLEAKLARHQHDLRETRPLHGRELRHA